MTYFLSFILAFIFVVPWIGIPLGVVILLMHLLRVYRESVASHPHRDDAQKEQWDSYVAKWHLEHAPDRLRLTPTLGASHLLARK